MALCMANLFGEVGARLGWFPGSAFLRPHGTCRSIRQRDSTERDLQKDSALIGHKQELSLPVSGFL